MPNFQLESTGKSRLKAAVPTLRGAFNYVLDLSDVLTERVQECHELEFKLVNFEDLSMSELELYEDLSVQEPSLDMQARRQNILASMKRIRTKLQAKTLSSIRKLLFFTGLHDIVLILLNTVDLVELALLLLWRHLKYYLDEERLNGSAKPTNGFESVRPGQSLRNNFDTRNLRQNASDALSLIFEKLNNLQIVGGSIA